MIAQLVTAPTAQPVTLAEAKAHLRITEPDDDALITRQISTATANVEQQLQRKLITQTWKMWLNSWPDEIVVRFGDLQSVTHVKYTDSDEDQSTFSSDDYLVDIDSVPGRIVLKDGESWPTDTLSPKNPIEVQFVTGYGDTTDDVPEDIRNALLYLVAHYHENREPLIIGTIAARVKMTLDALLHNHKVWPWIM